MTRRYLVERRDNCLRRDGPRLNACCGNETVPSAPPYLKDDHGSGGTGTGTGTDTGGCAWNVKRAPLIRYLNTVFIQCLYLAFFSPVPNA
ncbi:unnamed protein product [Fusarium venenatum]|uniref:Uncharacterized protein n=1 Tax=Fusarium venenatum TaxID=56646 RepID=A0A2L2TSQ9_9HYPO|nr:uncharacterized protein FVRRES_00702 [Fusarium venenatum]CEI64190.1 unnamed protein product [Fusarium venenatum]